MLEMITDKEACDERLFEMETKLETLKSCRPSPEVNLDAFYAHEKEISNLFVAIEEYKLKKGYRVNPFIKGGLSI